jgi:hypothetical protein
MTSNDEFARSARDGVVAADEELDRRLRELRWPTPPADVRERGLVAVLERRPHPSGRSSTPEDGKPKRR